MVARQFFTKSQAKKMWHHADFVTFLHSQRTMQRPNRTTLMRDIKKDKLLRTKFRLINAANPSEYEPLIRTCSEKYGVNSSLIKAVIHAESGYNPNAVSSKGASGLMQLMPGTARSLNVANSLDPKDNVEGGVKYLRFLLDTFHGDVSLALAAYNAGLGKVARYGGIPPYTETRTYVNRVLSYMQSYQAN
ncbi:Lytic transglycosylase, catalytic [Pelobacter propionicus DSM 2379]|uniref:Lytic transglycosylase, catalytic n=1 Tax=Pelobacter propionicus (strain DSM 2379 / NBRC 103807 / OttBd1) TaxID=338966 RepID=A1APW1_PELPD|nr:Lytic transglycosylase, catalytic [Pelobacter propionicus DSM 2379]